MSSSRIDRDNPVFFIFGDSAQAISHEEAQRAKPIDRVKSIWPFVVSEVIGFIRSLRPRERANYDAEDACMEIISMLLEKDPLWEPDRGRYITFAGDLIRKELYAIRDRARTVQSPRNSSYLLKRYESQDKEGVLSGRQAATASRIRRTLGEIEDIGIASIPVETRPEEEAEEREQKHIQVDAVMEGLRSLGPYEAAVAGKRYGLWGQPERSVQEIADETGRTPAEVRRALVSAHVKIEAHLAGIGHASAKPDGEADAFAMPEDL